MVAAILAMGYGCSSRNGGAGSDTEPTVIGTEPFDVETGAILEGDGFGAGSFAETRTLVSDVNFNPVYFSFDSAQLAPAEVGKIEDVARHLLQNRAHVVLVDGHCDERGSNEYNLSLGEQRAQSVRSYLVSLGVDGGRVQTRSFGEEKPAALGRTEDVYRLNRRGEFGIYK
ncbi:MAG: OmpA family protein [Lentisphaerae bacterium]|nr:OmpA family protein [Lentisphaerota bacterium]